MAYPFNGGIDGHIDIAGETASGPTQVGSRGGGCRHIVVARIDLGPENNLKTSRNEAVKNYEINNLHQDLRRDLAGG
jgi:hypothetical protein